MQDDVKRNFEITFLRNENKKLKDLIKQIAPMISRLPFNTLTEDEIAACEKIYGMFFKSTVEKIKEEN